MPRPARLPPRARAAADRGRQRAGHRDRRLRHLRQRLQVPFGRGDVLGRQRPAGLGQGAGHPGPRVLRPRRRARAGRGRALRRRDRRSRHRRADRAVRQVPLLHQRQVLDVRGAQHLRLPARRRRRRHGRLHARAADRARAQNPREPLARGRRADRADGLRDPRRQPRRHPARRRRRHRRRRPARPVDGAGRAPEDAEEAGRHRLGARAAGAGQGLRRRT